MKTLRFSMKDVNVLDLVIEQLREGLSHLDEDKVDEIVDNFGDHLRYGEYLDLQYDIEKNVITIEARK